MYQFDTMQDTAPSFNLDQFVNQLFQQQDNDSIGD
jgi:hypothetical protein